MVADNYGLLANAVVEQAADDYRKALCKLRDIEAEIKSLERFFTGDDIKMYTSLDGSMLLKGLQEQCEEHHYNFTAIKASLSRSKKN